MMPLPDPGHRARTALATYLRLLAACLQDEADQLEADPERSDDVLRRFREGVLLLSLEDAPLDVMMDRVLPGAGGNLDGMFPRGGDRREGNGLLLQLDSARQDGQRPNGGSGKTPRVR